MEQAEAPRPPSSKGNTAVELAYWDTIKSSGNPALLRSYLRQYPSGVFADLAKVMIEQLETASKQEDTNRSSTPAVKQSNNTEHELVYWNTVKDSDDVALLNAYLQRFPDGVFADLAKVMIAKLERAQKESPPKGQQPPEPMAEPEKKAEPQMAESDQPPPSRKSKVEVAALEPEPVLPPASTEDDADSDLPRKIQAALSAAGCSPGKVDGVWGRKSSAALALFARHANATLPSEEVSEATLRLFEGLTGRVCPLICGRGQIKQDGRCVARATPPREPAKKTATPNQQKPRKKKIRCASYGCEDIEDTQTINRQKKTAPAKRKTVCHSYGCDDPDLGW